MQRSDWNESRENTSPWLPSDWGDKDLWSYGCIIEEEKPTFDWELHYTQEAPPGIHTAISKMNMN